MRERKTLFAVVAVAFICLIILFIIVLTIDPQPSQLTENIILTADDFSYANFSYPFDLKQVSSKCSDLLLLPENDVLLTNKCSQVRFEGQNEKAVILNAIWIFNSPDYARDALQRMNEYSLTDGNLIFGNIMLPLGDKRVAFDFTGDFSGQPIFVRNIIWQDDNVLARLTYLGDTPATYDQLLQLAAAVELRIMVASTK